MRQRWPEPETSTRGFTIIELLVTLFVAAIFLIASYQLYIVVLRADSQTKAQTIAQNTAQDYLERYRTSVPSPCVASQPLSDSPITVSGLANVKISVTVSCPKSGSVSAITTLSKIDALIKYGQPETQLVFSAWSYSPDACGAGYVLVPGSSLFGVGSFCVMKYEAKNLNGAAISQAAGTPWVNISQNDAISTAAAACSSCHLITEAEWMTIAANVLSVPSNWSGGSVGSGYIYSGHNDNSPANVLAADSNDANGYAGTGNSSPSNQRRTLTLTNGEVIWDLAGNVWEWTQGTSTTGQPGITGETGYAWKQWPNVTAPGTLSPNPSPAATNLSGASAWTSSNGIGQLYSYSGETAVRGFFRGGHWYSGGSYAGVLMLSLYYAPSVADATVGFRVAKGLNDQPVQFAQPASCPTGFVPVPGDAHFGTAGFCVMKYEAKNDGSGNAVSTASGTPWVNISQTSAISTAAAACSSCHLITESEWMTIAANVLSVPSNWSSGTVGTGYIYQGHINNNPGGPLNASTDDSDGLNGMTGGIGGAGFNNRRTLTLTNGEVIWDFSGNVWEWTQGTINGGAQPGLSGESAYAWKQWNNPSLLMNGLLYGSQPASLASQPGLANINNWTSTNGIGQLYSNYGGTGLLAFLRGGSWSSPSYAGVLALDLHAPPGATGPALGFRVSR